jgi:UDP:flavonoid glycosyltransferase YjiC (YdhE family)
MALSEQSDIELSYRVVSLISPEIFRSPNDQPGVAARIAWTGTGEVIPLSRLNVPKLRNAIGRVLTQASYKQNALRLQQAIHRAGGVCRAADIIEQAIFTGKPVLAAEEINYSDRTQ